MRAIKTTIVNENDFELKTNLITPSTTRKATPIKLNF